MHYTASYGLREEFDDAEGMAVALGHLAEIAARQEAHRDAEQYYRRSLALYRDLGDRGGRATALCGLGRVACARGDCDSAHEFLSSALDIATEMQFVPLLTFIGEHASATRETKDTVDALLANADAPAAAVSAARRRAPGHELEAMLRAVRKAMDGAVEDAHADETAVLSVGGPASPLDQLSAREMDVLQLMANGRTNREIAEALGISLGTAKWHTSQIYSKLGVRNRTEAVAQARRQGIVP